METPISYKDVQLYFRGYDNTLEQFKFLEDHFDFYNGEKIVLTGVSSGGMGTFFYSTYLYEHTKSAKVYSIPDSGLFLVDFYSKVVGDQVLKKNVIPIANLVNEGTSGFPFP